MAMRRVMSIWFPELPLDRLRRMGDPRTEGNFAVTREVKNAWRLTHLSNAAKMCGLHVGMSLADARAIAPDLLTQDANPEREELLLRALWRWSDCLSPWSAIDPPDGLFLDITGCAHLFGGEQGFCDHTLQKLTSMQVSAKLAVCDTKLGAWGLARFTSQRQTIAQAGETREAISSLSLLALNINAKSQADLRRTGLKTIGDLYPFKTSDLARRYGLELTRQLSRSLGHEADPVSPQSADPVYSARMTLPAAIRRLEDVTGILERLAKSVCDRMERQKVGARRVRFILRSIDHGDHVLEVGFAKPTIAPAQITQQLARPLEDFKTRSGLDWFRFIATDTEPLRTRQIIMGEAGKRKDEDRTSVISTLGNRLGFDRIVRFVPQDSHVPECEFAHVEAVKRADNDWPIIVRPRPERIFVRPERLHVLEPGRPPKRFEWRKHIYQTAQAKGPERLLPEWWSARDTRTRDYWIATTDRGLRLWLLTHPATQPPQWFVAGRFA